jgi:hypothetical protein
MKIENFLILPHIAESEMCQYSKWLWMRQTNCHLLKKTLKKLLHVSRSVIANWTNAECRWVIELFNAWKDYHEPEDKENISMDKK